MSLIALKFVFAALVVLVLVALMWLVAELRQAPAEMRGLAILTAGVVLLLAAAAIAVTFGTGLFSLS